MLPPDVSATCGVWTPDDQQASVFVPAKRKVVRSQGNPIPSSQIGDRMALCTCAPPFREAFMAGNGFSCALSTSVYNEEVVWIYIFFFTGLQQFLRWFVLLASSKGGHSLLFSKFALATSLFFTMVHYRYFTTFGIFKVRSSLLKNSCFTPLSSLLLYFKGTVPRDFYIVFFHQTALSGL